jgi:hypothetical protein
MIIYYVIIYYNILADFEYLKKIEINTFRCQRMHTQQ